MQTLDRDEVSTVVAASPEDVYALVADVTRMPEFSPEVVSCRWLDGATGPAVGARFEAVNTTAAGRTWRNRPVVTVADPGREFAFTRTEPFAGTIAWRYRFEPVEDGTRVVESYDVRAAGEPGSAGSSSSRSSGAATAARRCAPGMRTTLERLRAAAEAAGRPTAPTDDPRAPSPTTPSSTLDAGGDDRAPGGAITVALCGSWSHEPPCPLAPHHTGVAADGQEVTLRRPLRGRGGRRGPGAGTGRRGPGPRRGDDPDGVRTTWRLLSAGPSAVRPEERDHAERLLRS